MLELLSEWSCGCW